MTFASLHIPEHLYFVTATLCGWKPLFSSPVYAKIILDSLQWLINENQAHIFAYVLMPHHLHAVLKPEADTIGQLLQQFGSFTAHVILKQLKQDQNQEWLQFFHHQRRDSRHQHGIWQDIQAKNIYTQAFLEQKLEYLHNNPVTERWQLVEERGDYPYSSACFYDQGKQPGIPVEDIRLWL